MVKKVQREEALISSYNQATENMVVNKTCKDIIQLTFLYYWASLFIYFLP